MKTFKQLLVELRACEEAIDWAQDMPIEEVVRTCHRGDWLLWLANKVDIDKRKLTLAKAHCANTVRHLMKDQRSINAIDVAIAYGNNQADDEQLKTSFTSAEVAATKSAAAAFLSPSDAAIIHIFSSAAATAVCAADNVARTKNLKQTADICREYIGQLLINKVNEQINK